MNMTAHDGILAGAELAATGQDYLSELRAWVTAYPEDALIQEEVRQLARDLDAVDEVADRRDAWPITDITGNLPRSLLSVAGCNGAVLTEGSVALLAGAGGVGKSALMVSLALGIARLNDGERGPVVDGIFDGVGGPVILVTYEDVPEVTAWRVRSLVAEVMKQEPETTRREAFSRIYVIDLLGRPLFGPMSAPGRSASYNAPPGPLSGWSDLWIAAARIKPGLIIIDPALSAFSGESNAAAPVREFLGALALKAKALGTGVLITAHSNKTARSGNQDPYDPGQVGGSAAWVDGARGVLAMTRHQPEDEGEAESSELKLAVAKSNYGPSLVTVGINAIRVAGGAIVGFKQVGGSAAWVDGARGVLAMTRHQPEDEGEAESSELKLAVAKSNYGPSLVTVGINAIRVAGGAIVGFKADGAWVGPGLSYSHQKSVEESGRKYASITD